MTEPTRTPDETRTMVRTVIAIDHDSFELSQGQDLEQLQRLIEKAAREDGKFVHFGIVGNRRVSALITSRSQVVFTTATVLFDARDTGDAASPYGGFYDEF
jgi:hypothetical protein